MIQQTAQSDKFKQQLRESLQRDTVNSHAVKIARHANIYTCGDQDEMIYFIESGRIKLLMLSPEGKECLLVIHSAGDIFGELSLTLHKNPRSKAGRGRSGGVLSQFGSLQLDFTKSELQGEVQN
jgi:CRP-like cAMP-binding protein